VIRAVPLSGLAHLIRHVPKDLFGQDFNMSVEIYQQLKLIIPEQTTSARRNIARSSLKAASKAKINSSVTVKNGDIAGPSKPNTQKESTHGPEVEAANLKDSEEVSDDEEANGTQLGFADVTEILEEGADKPEVMLTSKRKQGSSRAHDRFSAKSMVLRRRFHQPPGKEPVHDFNFIEINNENIRRAIRLCLGNYPFAKLSGSQIAFTEPYCELFHYREELQKYINDPSRSETELERLLILQDFMKEYLCDTIEAYNEHVLNGYVTFEYMWTLYRPNSIIVTRDHGQSRCYRVKSCEKDLKDWFIHCYYWGYREDYFGRIEEVIKIEEFDGERRIIDLKAVPLDNLPEEDKRKLVERLVERGYKWKKLCCLSHKCYNGEFSTLVGTVQAYTSRYRPAAREGQS
jgi:hypothetical protein